MVGRCVLVCQLSRQEQLVANYTIDVDDGLVPDTWHGRHDVAKSHRALIKRGTRDSIVRPYFVRSMFLKNAAIEGSQESLECKYK